MNYSLKRRFIITAFTMLLLLTIASSALFYTTNQYSYYIERSGRAQLVYSSYRAVSDHTYRKLSAIGQIVVENNLTNLHARYRNKEALRSALNDVRENIAAELALVGDVSETEELGHFNKIELLAEEIIRGSELVKVAVENNQPAKAVAALEKLRSDEIEGNFIRLIDEALSEELREVNETHRVAQDLNIVLSRLLSLVFLCFVFFGGVLLYTTWRALTRRLHSFKVATAAYQIGDFSPRVSNDLNDEFAGLAVALNNMAAEVESQRQREKSTQETLEAIIESRTHALKTSNQKLEAISETRKQFLADISHELRTPLTIILGETDFALRDESSTVEQYRSALRRVKEQTVHTTRFVQDLLFVARAEDGKAPIHKRPIDVVPLILDICDDFEVIAEERHISIVKTKPEQPLIADVDASKIKQVMTILLDNAVRYSYSDSSIGVNIQEINECLVVEVTDSGIGIKYHESSQVFSRFYRGSEGSGKAAGTGLGLPVAKAIIEAHGGSIRLEGESGEGSTATFDLPLANNLETAR